MVTTYGEWIYEPGTPDDKKCAMDRIAEAVLSITDKFKTTLENVCYMICADYESALKWSGRTGDEGYIRGLERYSAEDLDAFLYDMNGISEYDYYC